MGVCGCVCACVRVCVLWLYHVSNDTRGRTRGGVARAVDEFRRLRPESALLLRPAAAAPAAAPAAAADPALICLMLNGDDNFRSLECEQQILLGECTIP